MEQERKAVWPAAGEKNRRTIRLTTILAIVFLAGVAYGAVLSAATDSAANTLQKMTAEFLTGRAESSFQQIFWRTVRLSAALGIAMFLSGFSAAGQPFSIFILAFRGVGLGMSMAGFYTQPGGAGILVGLLCLAPAGALSGYALVLGCREAFRMSGRFFAAMTREEVIPSEAFRMYCVKFLIIGGMMLAAALLDAGITRFLLKLH